MSPKQTVIRTRLFGTCNSSTLVTQSLDVTNLFKYFSAHRKLPFRAGNVG